MSVAVLHPVDTSLPAPGGAAIEIQITDVMRDAQGWAVAAERDGHWITGHPFLMAALAVAAETACCALRASYAQDRVNLAWCEGQTAREGWRSVLTDREADFIAMLEEAGVARFVLAP